MVAAGKAKLTRKASRMKTSWEGARTRMKAGYDLTPFGPTRKANYKAGVDAGVFRVDPDKWARNFEANLVSIWD